MAHEIPLPATLISYTGNATILYHDGSPDSLKAARLAQNINHGKPGQIEIIGAASGDHRMPRLDTRDGKYFGLDVLGQLNRWS